MALPTNNGPGSQDPRPSGLPLPPQGGRDEKPVGYQAPRGGLPTPTAPLRQPVAPPLPAPPDEDDVFEQLSPEEAAEEEDFSFEPAQPQAHETPRVQESPAPEATFRPAREDQLITSGPDTSSQEEEESNFVNKKKKKLVPFGGAKSDPKAKKGKARAASFDSREDRRTKARAVQVGVLALLTGIVGFGAYNAFNPPAGVSADEMNAAIAQAVTNANFPKERGAAFATSFVGAYLTTTGNDERKEEILSYYYTGVLGIASTVENASFNGVSQKMLTTPQVYSYLAVSPQSASYTVGALIETAPTDPEVIASLGEDYLGPTVKWVYYNVNVYYDPVTEAMAVTPNSPTLVAPPVFGPADSIPDAKPLGTGEASEELADSVQSSLYTFFDAYGKASPVDRAGLENLVLGGTEADPSLLRGMEGRFRVSGGGDQGIAYTAYVGEESTETSPQVKAEVSVTWEDASLPEGQASATYVSTYYVELVPGAGADQWLVATIAPRLYLVDPALQVTN